MDRIMTVEERIRRAEDIYNRRNGGYSGVVLKNKEKKKNKNKKSNVKRLFMQIFICLFVYIIFYAVSNKEYVFSEEFRKEVNTFFTEKIKISEFYYKAREFMDSKFNTPIEENIEETKEKNEEENKEKQNVEEIKEKQKESKEENKEENIGGSIEDKQEEQTSESKDNISEQDLMEKNAAEIKEKISFILPVNGRISSTFGWRNPTTASVPKYHTGLDIAANEGTVIKSATDGKVIMASSKGDFGNHYQIQIDDIVIVYAHCKKLYLKEGDIVKQGQEIAEVGSTGNSTGPHLHFEIRKGEEKIDPGLILDF